MSSRVVRARHGRGLAIGLMIAATLLAASCSKKKVTVDPIDGLEGVPSPSLLGVWADTPIPDSIFADLGLPGVTPEDTLISATTTYLYGPGVVQGMIFDFTNASRFEAFRRESGGFQRFQDYTIGPSKKFFQGQTDVFRFHDQPPGAITQQAYVARGVVIGAGEADSPKTNVGQVTRPAVSGDLAYTAPTGLPPDFRPMSDSLLVMSWDPVPGAAWYFVHIYQFIAQGGDEIVRSATPAPMYIDVTRDYFAGVLPGNVTSYKIGDPIPSGGRVFASRSMLNGQVYQVRISALDGNGQLVAYTGTSGSFAVFRGVGSYRKFPLGAVLVQPKRAVAPPLPAGAGRATAIATSNPRLTLYPGPLR